MNNKLFIGNLSFEFTEDHLRETLTQVFSPYGKVVKVEIPIEKETRRIKGIAFVTMETEDEAKNAMSNLDGVELAAREDSNNYRPMKVEVAKPLPPRSSMPPRGPRN
jgi:RNA recognition motif-containing protein